MKKRTGFVSNSSSSSFIISSDWKHGGENVRYREIKYDDYGITSVAIEYQEFKRPYFWNMLGKKRWIHWYTDYNPETEFQTKDGK